MAEYNYAVAPLRTVLKADLMAAQSISMVAHIRPTWSNDGERLSFGVLPADPANSAQPGLVLDCQSNRTFGGAYNAVGCSFRHGAGFTFQGAASPPSDVTPDAWLWIGAVIRLNINPMQLYLYDRPSTAVPWALRWGPISVGAGPSYFSPQTAADALFIGNRRTWFTPNPAPTDERWPGGVASASLRIGNGVGFIPGGTEVAEWHPTPPQTNYTDAYGNEWELNGPTWRFGTVS